MGSLSVDSSRVVYGRKCPTVNASHMSCADEGTGGKRRRCLLSAYSISAR